MAEIDQPLARNDAISTSSSGDNIETGLLSFAGRYRNHQRGEEPTSLGGPGRVGNFSEQVWGELRERGQPSVSPTRTSPRQEPTSSAALAYAEVLRAKIGISEDEQGRPLDGTNLVNQAFARFAITPDRQNQARHAASKALATSMMRLYRNRRAHELEDIDADEAREVIATFSLLARLAEAETLIGEVDEED